MSWSGSYFGWEPRKTAAARRADAARKIKDAARRGKPMAPVTIAGRKIAHTFWGKAWCDNLERYRDFAHRLERGRSYVRSGSVIDLSLDVGKIVAVVSGLSLYEVVIEINAVKLDVWRAIQRGCAGNIGSCLDLLSGRLFDPVMVRLCADRTGLFPAPSAISFTCSCPDDAIMCKHVAAVMYGVGARLDRAPELLFTLRQVSADELLASAISELPSAPSRARVLAEDGLAALFGIELASAPPPQVRRAAKAAVATTKSTARGKPTTRKKRQGTKKSARPTTGRAKRRRPK